MRKTIIKWHFNSTQELVNFTILEVPPQTVSEVVDVVAGETKMGVRVEWTYKILGEIAAKRTS